MNYIAEGSIQLVPVIYGPSYFQPRVDCNIESLVRNQNAPQLRHNLLPFNTS